MRLHMGGRITGHLIGFRDFVREQGVMGLAIGFILGTAVSKVVTSFVENVLNPVIGLVLGSTDSIALWSLGPVKLGAFITAAVDFLIIALVVYALFRVLGLEKIEIKKL